MARPPPPTNVSVVLVTAPSEEVAATLARTLVEEHLIACANLVPKIRSIYRWEGTVHDEPEVLLVMKARSEGFAGLCARIKALHPYSVPEVLELPVRAGHRPYLDWVLAETTPPAQVVRRLKLKPMAKLPALRQALEALMPGATTESIRVRVDLNEYQSGTMTRFPGGLGVCLMDEREDCAPTDQIETEVSGPGDGPAQALENRLLETARGLGLTVV